MRIDQGRPAAPAAKKRPIKAGTKQFRNLAAASRRIDQVTAQAKKTYANKPAPSPTGDRPSQRKQDFKKAADYKSTPSYRAASRAAYQSGTIAQRHKVLANVGPSEKKPSTLEGRIAADEHTQRGRQDTKEKAKYGYVVRSIYPGKNGHQLARIGAAADNAAVGTYSGRDPDGTTKVGIRRRLLPGDVGMPANQIPKEAQDKLAARLAKATTGGVPNVERSRSALAKILGGASGGTKSSVLFALKQIGRPAAAIAAGAAADTNAKQHGPGKLLGGATPSAILSAMGEGFLHPEEHARDWNDVMRAKGIHNKYANEAASLTAGVATDPLTFLTAGAGSVAKKAAMEGYEKALAGGANEADAVRAARKIWDAAPEGQQLKGVKVGVRGLPAIVLSGGRTTHLETAPLGAKTRAAVRSAGRKAGVGDVRPFGVRPSTARNLANKVAPGVKPAGWNTLDWEFARRAARKTRAGEREAQRHAAYRLTAYKAATKDWTDAEHAQLRQAIEAKDTGRLPAKLKPVAQQIEKEMAAAQSQKIGLGLAKPQAADSRVGAGSAPQLPQYATRVNPAHVERARKEVQAAVNAVKTAVKNVGYENGRRSALHTMAVGATPIKSLGQQQAEAKLGAALSRVENVRSAHVTLTKEAARQRDAMAEYSKAFAKWQKAPKGFYPRSLAPGVLDRGGSQLPGRGTERIVDHARKHTEALEFMPPEQVAKYEGRTPVAIANYLLKHGRTTNLAALNQRIGALGHEVKLQPSDVEHLAGQRVELFAEDAHGIRPVFNKEGVVDPEKLAKAIGSGHRIVEVDRAQAERIRSMARGQRDFAGNTPELQMAAHGPDESDLHGTLAGYDKLQRNLKILQTSVNPAYHITNIIGDTFNSVISGARAGDFAAGKRLRKIESALKQADLELDPMNPTGKLHGANPLSRATKQILDNAKQHIEHYGKNGDLSDLDIVKLGVAHGALRTGLTSGELRAASRGAALEVQHSAVGRGMEKLQNVSDWREDLVRLSTFRSAMKRDMSPDEAAEWANKHHFDYADLSPIEQKFFRRIIPFWTFTARNTPLQVRSIAARPGVYATEEKARAQSADMADLPPDFADKLREFEQTGAPWGTPLKMVLKDTKVGHITAPITAYPKLPFMDLANIPFPQFSSEGQPVAGATAREAGMNLLGRVTPFAKVPLEQILGISTFTGTAQKDMVQAPSWVPKGLTKPMQDPRTGKMVRGISWRVLEPLQSAPITNMLSRQGTSTLHGQPEAGNLKWAGWLGGPRPAIQDPRVVKINSLFEQRDKLTHELNLLKPTVHHERGEDWGGKIRKKMDAIKLINNRIYELSARTGAKNPAGVPPAKPRNRKQSIGGFGSGGFKGGTGSVGGGFK